MLTGPFCAACGQRDVRLDLPARGLLREGFREFLDIDRRFIRTVRILFARPGHLTRVYAHGARVRHTSPFRLYLAASVMFFAAYVLTQGPRESYNDARNPRNAEVAQAIQRMIDQGDLPAPATSSFPGRIRDPLPALRAGEARSVLDRATFIDQYSRNLSRALFLSLPVLAIILAIVPGGRRWPIIRHVAFALHFGAVFLIGFLVLMIAGVAVKLVLTAAGIAATDVPDVNVVLYGAGAVGLVLHLRSAMRRAYPESRVRGAMRFALTALLFAASLFAAFLGAVMYTLLMLA